MNRKCLILLFLFFQFILIYVSFANAHLEGGKDINKGGYIADFGYSPKNIKAKEKTNFLINLVDAKTKKIVDIDSIWMKISLNKNTLFAGNMKAKNGGTTFSYVFSNGGSHDIDVKFKNNTGTILKTSISVDVKDKNNFLNRFYLEFILIFFIIIFIMFIYKNHKKTG